MDYAKNNLILTVIERSATYPFPEKKISIGNVCGGHICSIFSGWRIAPDGFTTQFFELDTQKIFMITVTANISEVDIDEVGDAEYFTRKTSAELCNDTKQQ